MRLHVPDADGSVVHDVQQPFVCRDEVFVQGSESDSGVHEKRYFVLDVSLPQVHEEAVAVTVVV